MPLGDISLATVLLLAEVNATDAKGYAWGNRGFNRAQGDEIHLCMLLLKIH